MTCGVAWVSSWDTLVTATMFLQQYASRVHVLLKNSVNTVLLPYNPQSNGTMGIFRNVRVAPITNFTDSQAMLALGVIRGEVRVQSGVPYVGCSLLARARVRHMYSRCLLLWMWVCGVQPQTGNSSSMV